MQTQGYFSAFEWERPRPRLQPSFSHHAPCLSAWLMHCMAIMHAQLCYTIACLHPGFKRQRARSRLLICRKVSFSTNDNCAKVKLPFAGIVVLCTTSDSHGLATRAYEAVKFEDSDLVVGRVDSLVQHFPEFKRKSEFKGEAWKALHGYITVHLPLDYERQLCPECVHWTQHMQ